MNKVLKNKNGFTLVELIVVMAVLAVISAIAVPRFLGVQDQAKLDADYATGAMIAKAAELYYVKEDNVVSPITASDLITEEYINGVEFKSGKFSSYTAATVQITFTGTGVVEVDANDGVAAAVPLYPRP